ncbi:pyridoxamine 5'-phosphate oxidase family protein [Neolewinella sp.]|uniref:pyridoxamine 5'-phosphate oxidase family protein n=1 Tax=Neolewinella sp. TaxID=2993543 RepID=UPI003B528167
MLYARRSSELLLHASPKSRFYRVLSEGIPCTLGVTFVDGLVLARSAFHHSVNYRSVVAFGSCTEVTDPAEKLEAFRYFTNAIVPDRFEECRPTHAQEAEVTGVLSFAITAASAKVRTGGPNDDAADYALPIWAGVVPYVTGYGSPVTDESGVRGVELPASVVALLGR